MPERVEIAVIGGGAMGSGAAYHLARSGRRVTLFEQFEIGHKWGSSHGPSRIIRLSYDGADYVELARAAYDQWRELELTTGEELLVPVGGLDLGSPEANRMQEITRSLDETGVAYESLTRDAMAARWPQFNFPEDVVGIFQSDYSILAADRCVATMSNEARKAGADIREQTAVIEIVPDADGVTLTTSAGVVRADKLIITAGSWAKSLFRQLGIDVPLVVLKEQLAYFAVPAASRATYLPDQLPLVLHHFPGTTSIGAIFPIYGHDGVKMMIDRTGPVVTDSADTDRSIDADLLERLRAYTVELLPELSGEILETLSCRYTMTPDEDFILDRLPEFPHVVLASPCSAHGFKFSIVVGQIACELASTGTSSFDLSRFRLDRPALAN